MSDRIVFAHDPSGRTATGFELAHDEQEMGDLQAAATRVGNVEVRFLEPSSEAAAWWGSQALAWAGGAVRVAPASARTTAEVNQALATVTGPAEREAQKAMRDGGAVAYLVAKRANRYDDPASLEPFRAALQTVRQERAQAQNASKPRGVRSWPVFRLFGN